MFSKEFEVRQHQINATVGPECIGNLRKIATESSNWEIYYNDQYGYCESIAKPGSGASDSVYGNLAYIARQLRTGYIKPSQLTRYGRRIMRRNGYKV